MQGKAKSYKKILSVTTHASFICYTLGYLMGLLDYRSMGFSNLVIENFIIIIIFLITYLLFIFNKISFQTAMKVLSIMIVLDMLYPGIILPGHIPVIYFHEETVAMDLILVFIIAFTTNKKFAISITVSIITLLVINAVLFNDTIMLKIMPTVILCIGGMGVFSIIFEDLIKKLLIQENESKNKIQELSNYKQNITRHVIHDLKVPVNSILNLSAGEENLSSRKIYSQALDINKQLEKILDVERLEEPNISLNMESIPVNKLIDKAIFSVSILASEKNITIIPEFNATGKLLCDTDLTERLIINILSNAVKYSPLNERIFITVNGNDKNCNLLIKDNGPGIEQEHLEHIFEKFYFIKTEKSKSSFSTGLGLAFCKLVTDAHKGEIMVRSEIGKGTEFEIIIPGYNPEHCVSNNVSKPILQKFTLTNDEQEMLSMVCLQIKNIPIYKASEIMIRIQHLAKDKRKNVQYWYERLTDAVYTGNNELYKEMTDPFIPDKK